MAAKADRKHMVMKLDPEGLPRAWGIAPTIAAARGEADRQLGLYIEKRKGLGECWHEVSDFTEERHTLPAEKEEAAHG